MPLAFSDVRRNIIGFISDSHIWNSLISNAFTIGIIVSLSLLLILLVVYDEKKSNTRNIIGFVLYSTIFSTLAFALHDSILISNYDKKRNTELESSIVTNTLTSNRQDAKFFNDIVPVNVPMQQNNIEQEMLGMDGGGFNASQGFAMANQGLNVAGQGLNQAQAMQMQAQNVAGQAQNTTMQAQNMAGQVRGLNGASGGGVNFQMPIVTK